MGGIGGAAEEAQVPWTRIAGLEVHEEIGRGGMGVVYRARQANLDRAVAVKVLLGAQFAGQEGRERFLREARAAAKLDHPGIVRMFDFGEEDGMPWFSMEYVPGVDLEESLRETLPAAKEAAALVAGLADAVAHAHARGVLHRDLKPSNILLDEAGRPRITDFGIARSFGSDAEAPALTQTGQMLGSPGYVAPEQVLHGEAGVKTDVYGLGAVLYHVLTGQSPFRGPTLESILLQLRENEPIPPRVFHPSLHRDLETICLKCLRKNPAGRYGSAAEVAADLRRFLAGEPVQARPPGPWESAWYWASRHPREAVLLGFVFLLAGGLVTASLWFARDKARSEHRASLLAEARSLRQTRLAGSRSEALDKLRMAWEMRPGKEILDEAVAALALVDLKVSGDPSLSDKDEKAHEPDHPEVVIGPDGVVVRDRVSEKQIAEFSPPGKVALAATDESGLRLAFTAPDAGELRLISADGLLNVVCQHPMAVQDIAWSGELIATTCANRFIYIWEAAGNLKHRLSGHDSYDIRVAFRPRSQILASTANDSHIRLWHAARGEELLLLEHTHPAHHELWWSADGRLLIGQAADGHRDVYQTPDGDAVRVFSPPQEEPHSENLGSADLSHDGRFAVSIDEATARIWDFEQGALMLTHPKQTGQWLGAKFHPVRGTLFTCGWADPLREWTVLPKPQSRTLADAPGYLLRGISADGRFIVLSNNSIGTFTVVDASANKIADIAQAAVLACAIAPDGSWLATSSYAKPGARVWSLPDGKLLADLCSGETVMQALALGPHKLVTRSSARIRVFDTRRWSELPGPAPGLQLSSLTATRDGGWLAGLGNHDIRVINPEGFAEVLRLTPPQHAGWLGECHVAFDAGGRFLFVQTALGAVIRWDLGTIATELRTQGMSSGFHHNLPAPHQ